MSYRTSRLVAVLASLLAFATLVAPAASSTSRAHRMASFEESVLAKLNGVRARHGLRPLHLNSELTDAAAQHSDEMGSDGYFEHNSFDGTPFWKRIGRFYSASGRGYWSVGENLLWSTGPLDSRAAVAEWMSSPPHRANILSPQWREIGIGAATFSSAGGVYAGRTVTIITTDFGVRR